MTGLVLIRHGETIWHVENPGSGDNAADFYPKVLHAMSTPALMDRQIVTSIRNHVRPEQRGNPGQVLVLDLSGGAGR
jgi:broad specificity phosphatase PhoE